MEVHFIVRIMCGSLHGAFSIWQQIKISFCCEHWYCFYLLFGLKCLFLFGTPFFEFFKYFYFLVNEKICEFWCSIADKKNFFYERYLSQLWSEFLANYGLSFKPINFYRLVGRLYNFFDFYENYMLFGINSEI